MVKKGIYTSNALKADFDDNPLDKLPSILKKDLDKNLCACMDVPRMDVINTIVNGATNTRQWWKR